jgi:hypothetical protein
MGIKLWVHKISAKVFIDKGNCDVQLMQIWKEFSTGQDSGENGFIESGYIKMNTKAIEFT